VPVGAGAAGGMTEKMFFFEKKNQKTFGHWHTGSGERICQ
jgi:hypothetical protein